MLIEPLITMLLLSFTLASLLLALAPGPDNIFVLTHSALYGARSGIAVIVGLCLGIMVHTLCLIVGISALLAAYPTLLLFIKLLGVAYLSYLAYQAFLAALKAQGMSTNHSQKLESKALIKRGFFMNITNPKVQLFFLSFFPQFLPPDAQGLNLALQILILGLIFALATLLVFSIIALSSTLLRSAFVSPTFNRYLNGSAAFIFSALALYTLYNC